MSGDTSAGGLRRLDWALEGNVRILILALGANDGLRGLPIAEMKQNLDDDHRARAREERRRDPRRHGSAAELRPGVRAVVPQAFRDVAQQGARAASSRSCSTRWPASATLNQADGIHPNAEGARDHRRHASGPCCASVLDQMARASVIELRGVSKTVPSGDGTLTILHPLDLVIPERPRRRDHRRLGQRQVDAARPARRPRRAVDRHASSSTASTSPRSARTRWRGCAASASASSSSSFTCCRR